MITCMMHIMTHSFIHGDGVMVGHGDHGAVGMDHSGGGIILMPGAIGAGDMVGITDIMLGTTEDTQIEEADYTIVSTEVNVFELIHCQMAGIQVFQEEPLKAGQIVLLQEET